MKYRTNKIRRLVIILLQMLFGVFIVLGIGLGIQHIRLLRAKSTSPPGWKIIRPPNAVSAMVVVNDLIWAGGKDGVTVLNRKTAAQQALPKGAPEFSFVRAMLVDSQGTLWIGHDDGLARYKNQKWIIDTKSTGAPLHDVLSILETKDGSFWIGTTGGLARWAKGKWFSISLPSSISIAAANTLYQDKSGAIWVGCSDKFRGGLYRFFHGKWLIFRRKEGLPHNSVNMLIQDKSGTLWAATGQANTGGLARWRNGHWESAELPAAQTGKNIRSLFLDHAGNLWIGSEYDGISVKISDGWHVYTAREGLAGSEVLAFVQDADNIYWLGTNLGLSRNPSFAELHP